MPDLILISATGGDSALALYDQLSAIAPTLIINYDDKSWQELLTQLGTMTGHEKQAAERIAAFDKQLAQVKQQMKLPPQPVNAIVTPPPRTRRTCGRQNRRRASCYTSWALRWRRYPMGCTPQKPGQASRHYSAGWRKSGDGAERRRAVRVCRRRERRECDLRQPAAGAFTVGENKRVWALGTETFRPDYYSAMLVLDRLNALFK